ncbi:MAG: 5-formyltetrahydrofolate cyclo-ligase [Planctomycetaceae bacterium]
MIHPSDEAFSKPNLRKLIRQQLRGRTEVEERSSRIFEHLYYSTPWREAKSILWYVSLQGEVQTQPSLRRELEAGRRCAVTWCEPDRLRLVWLHDMSELASRTLNILEPVSEIREDPRRWLEIGEVDLVLVPGLAFDRQGNRLGRGKGYYDRLLSQALPRTTLVALAFEEQILESIPIEPHDVKMDYIATENGMIRPVDG